MTSKEALERIKSNAIESGSSIAKSKGIEAKDIIKTITIGDVTKIIYPEEELNIIEKDLEVLDILKSCMEECFKVKEDGDYATFNFCLCWKEEDKTKFENYNKIKEWLKNE